MSISVCAISGSPLVHAVISIKTGHLFEKSVIVKHLNSFPYCPVTNQPLSIEDLIDVKATNTLVSSSSSAIPVLLEKLTNEYDTLVLESFYLKKHLHETRQQLSHALYQHDASLRVIAKLVKERDQARNNIADLNLKVQELQRSHKDN